MHHIGMSLFASLILLFSPLTTERAFDIGLRVWQNECAGTLEGLTSWNQGEEFPSLGIGHFIWYPSNKRGPFVETFPQLLQFFQSKGVSMPRWLEEARFCPWKTREQFLRSKTEKRMVELRRLLKETIALQAQFLALRLEEALPSLLINAGTEERKEKIRSRFESLAALPHGIYALVDYVNFKGLGTSPEEQYAGEGWGLFQVLNAMSNDPSQDPVEEFVRVAKATLQRRVVHSPALRNEQRFLAGWLSRLDSYLKVKKTR